MLWVVPNPKINIQDQLSGREGSSQIMELASDIIKYPHCVVQVLVISNMLNNYLTMFVCMNRPNVKEKKTLSALIDTYT